MATGEAPGNEAFAGLILKGVKETGEEIGVGAYGRVFAVDYYGTVCAAKEIHSNLIGSTQLTKPVYYFLKECQQCAELRHPNIVYGRLLQARVSPACIGDGEDGREFTMFTRA